MPELWMELETGTHVALVCNAGEWPGRKWSSWEQADETTVDAEAEGG